MIYFVGFGESWILVSYVKIFIFGNGWVDICFIVDSFVGVFFVVVIVVIIVKVRWFVVW